MNNHELLRRAPAKINLGLEVLRRREDGFHDINTIFAAVDLHDEVHLRSRPDNLITCSVEGNSQLDGGEDNLCVRAARALRDRMGDQEIGLDIRLLKRIPIGAGLGGGSSDAASVLLGAAELWQANISLEGLHPLASSLGSDVPFFLQGGIALAESRGELLNPLHLSLPFSLLLINSGLHISTPWAYRAVARSGDRLPSDLAGILERGVDDPGILRREMVNDFEEPVFVGHPTLKELKKRLYDSRALFAAMSGSGSTMFGLFSDRTGAEQAAEMFGDCWAVWRDLCRRRGTRSQEAKKPKSQGTIKKVRA